jgi:hypothetical protein
MGWSSSAALFRPVDKFHLHLIHATAVNGYRGEPGFNLA